MTEPLPKVWSERRAGAWDQCTECAYLMAMLYGGWRTWPDGAYTDAERNALDAATPPDPPAGGSTFPLIDTGAQRRYGVTLHRIPDGDRDELQRQLRIPGQALAVAGSPGHFPRGHRLRRWQPDFTGGHAVCVVTLGEGRVQWLDPLAPMGFEGDQVLIGAVLTFAWFPNDARIIVGGAWQADERLRLVRALRRKVELMADEADSADATIDRLRARLRRIREIAAEPE